MSNWKKTGKVLSNGNIRTPVGRMVYPNLLKPRHNKREDGTESYDYEVNLAFPPGTDLSLLKKTLKDVIVAKHGEDGLKSRKLKTPIRDAAEAFEKIDFDFEGWTCVRAKTQSRPAVVDADVNEVEDEADVYGGRWASISVRPYAWGPNKGGIGASFDLSNVQLLEHADNLGPGKVDPSKEFEAVETEDGAGAEDDDFPTKKRSAMDALDDEIPF